MMMKLTPRLGLQQHLTPQLILLMRIMALASQELLQEVTKALEENPLLEEDIADEATEPPSSDEDRRFMEHLSGGPAGSVNAPVEREADDDRPRQDPGEPVDRDLRDHLLEQLHEEESIARSLLPIGEWIIENLDERGFL